MRQVILLDDFVTWWFCRSGPRGMWFGRFSGVRGILTLSMEPSVVCS